MCLLIQFKSNLDAFDSLRFCGNFSCLVYWNTWWNAAKPSANAQVSQQTGVHFFYATNCSKAFKFLLCHFQIHPLANQQKKSSVNMLAGWNFWKDSFIPKIWSVRRKWSDSMTSLLFKKLWSYIDFVFLYSANSWRKSCCCTAFTTWSFIFWSHNKNSSEDNIQVHRRTSRRALFLWVRLSLSLPSIVNYCLLCLESVFNSWSLYPASHRWIQSNTSKKRQ